MFELIRQRWNSKTYRVGIILSLITIIEANANLVGQYFPPEHRQWLLAVWPLAMLGMREWTKTALADK